MFIITAGGINNASISLIHHFKNIQENENIQGKLKKKQKNLDRAEQQIPNENKGFWGGTQIEFSALRPTLDPYARKGGSHVHLADAESASPFCHLKKSKHAPSACPPASLLHMESSPHLCLIKSVAKCHNGLIHR